MKESFKLGLYLFVIAAVAGLALAAVNHLTRDRIAEQKSAHEQAALRDVLPRAASFRAQADCQEGLDASGAVVGYVLKVKAQGYSSVIEALVGVDPEFKVTGVRILSQNETPGLGDKVRDPRFTGQFAGKDATEIRLKKDGGAIDAITSATISSRALTGAIQERLDEFQKTRR